MSLGDSEVKFAAKNKIETMETVRDCHQGHMSLPGQGMSTLISKISTY